MEKTYKVNVSTVTIKAIDIQYDHQLKWLKRPSDIVLEFTYDTGYNFDKQMRLIGNFNKEKASWGSAWYTVGKFFQAAGIEKPTIKDDFSVPEHYIDQVIGREIKILSYPSKSIKNQDLPEWDFKRYYWNDFMQIYPVGTSNEIIKEDFIEALENPYSKLEHRVNTSIPDKPKEDEVVTDEIDIEENEFDFAEVDA